MHNIDVYVKFLNDRTQASTLFTRRSAVGRADARLYLESQLSRAFVFAGGGIHPARATGHLVVEKIRIPTFRRNTNQTKQHFMHRQVRGMFIY